MPHFDGNNTLPSRSCTAITASDSTNLTYLTRAIYVGGAGNVVAVFPDDSTVTFTAVPAGTVLPLVVKRINSTSTTATAMVAIY